MMKEQVYRYILIDNETKEYIDGMLQGLEELPAHFAGEIASQFDDLPLPPSHIFRNATESWFTEKGAQKYKNACLQAEHIYKTYSGMTLLKLTRTINTNHCLYSDDYQVIIPAGTKVA